MERHGPAWADKTHCGMGAVMAFGGVFHPVFRPIFDPIGAVAAAPPAVDWWEAGNAPAPIAVWQPKAAASQAASYSNVVNPGTYDAAPGTAPSWSSAGWACNGSTHYLTTGLTPADTDYVYVVRFSSVAGSGARGLFGSYSSGAGASMIQVNDSGMDAYNGADYPSGYVNNAPTMTAGVYAIEGKTLYRDGVAEASSVPAGSGTFLAAFLGAININGSAGNFFNGTIEAAAVWDTTTDAATWLPLVMAAVALI